VYTAFVTLKPTQSVSEELAERLASLRQLQEELNAAIAAGDERISNQNRSSVDRQTAETVATVAKPPNVG
jgi:hypothetical protein